MNEHVELCGGSIQIWLDQDVVMLKAVETSGDPVELNAEEARQVADALLKLPGDAST